MNNHNSQSRLPEVRGRGRELEIGERHHLAGTVERGWVAIKAALSVTADAHYVPGTYEQSTAYEQSSVPAQPQPSMAERLLQTAPFNPVQAEVVHQHLSDSQVSSEAMGTLDPEHIRDLVEQPDPDALALQELAKNNALDEVYAAYRADAGLPPQAEGPTVTELSMTPLQRAERDFPNDEHYLVGDIDVTMGDIRSAVGSAYEDTETPS